MYTGHNCNRKLRPTEEKKINEVTRGGQNAPACVGGGAETKVGTLLRMILVPGCSQEHAHSRLELGDYGHRVQWERLVRSTFCMEEVTFRG